MFYNFMLLAQSFILRPLHVSGRDRKLHLIYKWLLKFGSIENLDSGQEHYLNFLQSPWSAEISVKMELLLKLRQLAAGVGGPGSFCCALLAVRQI